MQSVTDLKDTSPKLEPDTSRHRHGKNNSQESFLWNINILKKVKAKLKCRYVA
jgi:hypothetical protein